MDEVEKRVLGQMRSKLIKEMVVTESFLSAFCYSNILDDSLSCILKSEKNYEQRAGKLLELLPSRGSKAFGTLMEILEITNPWLSEKMRAALHDERNKDAKINLHPSVAKSATIEGFGESRLHIDVDIKERSAKYVRTNMYHLTDAEQRGVEKWMADELQRERRRQQFRAPHKIPRDPREFHASKECQTETSIMDIRDIFEEMATYLHGVDVVETMGDISFGTMQEQIRELLSRTRKLDALFLNCLSKFDDSTKYTMTLPELIDKTVHNEKDLQLSESESKKTIKKLREDNEGFKRHIRRLEEHVDRLIQRQTQGMRPQEIQLRQRQDVHFRYTLPAPADSGHFAVSRMHKLGRDGMETNELGESGSHGLNANDSTAYYNGGHEPINGMNVIDNHSHSEDNKSASNRGVPDTESRANDSKRKSSIDFTHHTSLNHGKAYVNAAGQKIHKVEPVHYEDQNGIAYRNNWKSNGKGTAQVLHHSQNSQALNKNSKETTLSDDNSRQMNGPANEPSRKIRRHASEENLRIEVGQEENEITSTKWLDPAQFEVSIRRNSLENASQLATYQQQIRQQQQLQRHGSNADHLQRILPDHPRHNHNQQGRNASQESSDRHMISSTSESFSQTKHTPSRHRDSSPITITKGKSSTRAMGKSGVSSMESTDSGLVPQQHFVFHQNHPVFCPEPLHGRQPHVDHSPSGQSRYPYRSSSSDRVNLSGSSRRPLSVVSPVSHSSEYLSDSEMVVMKSSLRGKTARPDRSRAKVRFATPVIKHLGPQRKVPVRTNKAAHYQMDTASTTMRKIKV